MKPDWMLSMATSGGGCSGGKPGPAQWSRATAAARLLAAGALATVSGYGWAAEPPAKVAPAPSKSAAPVPGKPLGVPMAQQLLLAQSDIRFVTTQMGVPVEGRFRQFSAQTAFDPRSLQTARIGMAIDMGSATFGIRDTDAELGKPEWFHTPRFPQARFDSTAIRAVAPGRFEVQGQLTIKGVSKPLNVPVNLTQSAAPQGLLTMARGEFVIKRMDFKIGDGEWGDPSIVANEVTVKFNLALLGVAPL